MRKYLSIAVENNMHFVLYRYCCKSGSLTVTGSCIGCHCTTLF